MAFGDLNITTREINDEVITNNGDALKILATVVSTVYAFIGKFPDAFIYATGSSEARTKLYRMGIRTKKRFFFGGCLLQSHSSLPDRETRISNYM